MKQLIGILLLAAILSGLSSCLNTSVEKPEKLIPKEKFEKMLLDIYLIQGITTGADEPETMKKFTQTDLYFSVLAKYDVPDTVFIRSLIYYSSFPKDYEKMHTQIINNLNEAEQQFKPKDKLNEEPK